MSHSQNKPLAIKIGKIVISEKSPTVIIAEVACEHRGSMTSAKSLIKAAKDAGADIVKFQLHVPEAEMVSGKIKFWAGSILRHRRLSLPG